MRDDERWRPSREVLVSTCAVLVPVALAVALASIDLGGRSLWIDESATFAISSQHGRALLDAMRRDGGNMLAFYGLEHLLIGWFGRSTVVLRLPSVVAGGVTAGGVTLIGRRLFAELTGTVAGVLTAVSLPLVYWSQDARGYSLMVAFCTLSFLGFVGLAGDGSPGRPGRPPAWAFVLYTGGLILAIYMSFVAVLIVPAQLLALVWGHRRLKHVALALATTAVAGVPLLLLAHSRGAAQLFWLGRPGAAATGEVAEAITSSGLPPLFHTSALTLPLLAGTFVLLLTFALRARGAGVARPLHGERRFAVVLVTGWALLPAMLDGLESLVGQSLYEARYLLISAPAFSLAASAALFAGGLRRSLAWLLLAALLAARAVVLAPSYGVSPENWRAATEFVLHHEKKGECIAFYPEDGRQAVDYYLLSAGARRLPRPVLPDEPWRVVKPYVERYVTLPPSRRRTVASSCRTLFLVSSHAGSATGTPRSRAVHHGLEEMVAGLSALYQASSERSFGYAAPIRVWQFSR